MSFKSRKLSLDSILSADGNGVSQRGSSRSGSKKSKQSQSPDDARQEIQDLSRDSSMSFREEAIAEDSLERSDELNHHSFLKRNKSFHKLFQDIPEEENVTHTFICALQKEVLYHGKLFVSDSHVCFYSSVLLKDTKVVIPVNSIKEVKKHNSALSMLSIQTTGEKYSFVSLRNRDLCYKLLRKSHAQRQRSPNGSPLLSSAENEAENDLFFSSSGLEDNVDYDLDRRNSINLDSSFHQMSSEDPTRCSPAHQSILNDADDRAVLWIWRLAEMVAPFFSLRETGHVSIIFYIYVTLTVMLLLAFGYIGLRILALEEQLNSLGALTELSWHYREYQDR